MRYNKAERLLGLALRLQATREGLTLDEMAADAGVSRRTTERMLRAIERVFPQLEHANPGEKLKRWRLPAGTLAKADLISAEHLAALESARQLLLRDNRRHDAGHLERLSLLLRAAQSDRATARTAPDLEALIEAEGYAARPGPRPRLDEKTVTALREAILARSKVNLHYRARGTGERSRQLVCPYGFLYGGRHYLVAFSLNEQVRDWRLFSLADIERVEILDWPFVRRPDFSLAAYAARSFGVYQEEPVDVAWRFSARAAHDARSFSFHPGQTFEAQPDGSLVVRFRAGGLKEMCWHLFTWGGEVEILKPEALREMDREMLEEATGVAGNATAARRC